MFKVLKEIHSSIFPKLLLIFAVFFSIEISFKVRRFLLYCYKNESCDYLVDVLRIKQGATLGLGSKHEKLGYTSKENLDLTINSYGWKNINLKTIKNGIRYDEKNSNPIDVLVVGESSAFGAQVKNNQTWQSCLNRKQSKYNFINAAVFNYGPGLSYLRAEYLSNEFKPKFIILSTLIGAGFERDKRSFTGGYPAVSIIKTSKGLTFSDPPNPNKAGSKYSDEKPKIINYILAMSDLISKYQPIHRQIVSNSYSQDHPEAASVEEIRPWVVQKTKSFRVPFIWVIQYQNQITKKMEYERKSLVNELKKNNIDFVDTYEYLHGKKSGFGKNELWNMHHTAIGNDQVCTSILDYLNKK